MAKRGRKPLTASKPCGHCGAEMQLTPSRAARRAFCSMECSAASKRAPEVDCPECGTAFRPVITGGMLQRYCGTACGRQARWSLHRHVWAEVWALRRIGQRHRDRIEMEPIRVKVRAEAAALRRIGVNFTKRQVSHGGPKVARVPCASCGVIVVRLRRPGSTVCPPCAEEADRRTRRVAKAKRRAITRGVDAENIDPLVVFARDRWRCQLCGVATPKRLRGTYDSRAPELDHIVSLAEGGAHTWSNVQCACRQCNHAKGASSRGQLHLNIA